MKEVNSVLTLLILFVLLLDGWVVCMFFFFFSSRRRHTRWTGDWSSDVCSSDLVTLASIIADTLVAMYNPQLATWRTSPAANEIERHTLAWLTGKFGFPATAIASFTNGGAEANLSAVIVALTRTFPDYGEHGLRRLTASPAIYLTSEAHHSFNKIAHMTGLGRRAVRTVASDRHLKMDLGDLARRVAEDRRDGFAPFMVVGTVGTTAAGAIDPFPDLARSW